MNPLGTNLNELWRKIQKLLYKKMNFKNAFYKIVAICPSRDVMIGQLYAQHSSIDEIENISN